MGENETSTKEKQMKHFHINFHRMDEEVSIPYMLIAKHAHQLDWVPYGGNLSTWV